MRAPYYCDEDGEGLFVLDGLDSTDNDTLTQS